MRKLLFLLTLLRLLPAAGQHLVTPFEQSKGTETATYAECINFYGQLTKVSPHIIIRKMGMSDAGHPLHLVLNSGGGQLDPRAWHRQHKVTLLIINGIHPGEPDGIDACMLLLRDLAEGIIKIPRNIGLAIIPLYNIGGALNRNSFSRVNQNGPRHYGFRGNAQNLDLNRDFTKADSRNANAFAEIFHWVDPDIQIDTHVSDGADYQHTMTLISTQWNKLGGELGKFLHDTFEPAIRRSMDKKGWPICPYVNFEYGNPQNGWTAFYDPPRYSSGYATLFHTLSFIPETHMLKPFRDRVYSTYALIQTILENAALEGSTILEKRKRDYKDDLQKNEFALSWIPDSTRFDSIHFKGYEASYKTSEVTGKKRLFYDHDKPFEKEVKFYDYYKENRWATAPKAYIIPQG